ncbi:MAG: superoxide dismutase, partial [Gammaproteobacteria bacterium]
MHVPQPPRSTRRHWLAQCASLAAVSALGGTWPGRAHAAPIALPPLPYADDALAPVISANTLGFHYGKHHR